MSINGGGSYALDHSSQKIDLVERTLDPTEAVPEAETTPETVEQPKAKKSTSTAE